MVINAKLILDPATGFAFTAKTVLFCFFYLHVDVQEAALGHLEHEAHLGARVDSLVKALLGVSINADKVTGRSGAQRCQDNRHFRKGQHGENSDFNKI